MAIVTKKVSQWGRNYKISEHFTLGEFQCKDGNDSVKYSTELLKLLEKLRSYGNFNISINSGYRTAAYNKKIHGASNSNHVKGLAADIKVSQDGKIVPAKYICCICQDLGFPGIAMIKGGNSTHVDSRTSGKYRGDETYGYTNNVGGNFYKYFNINKSDIEKFKVNLIKENEEDEEMIYKNLSEVPDWGKDSVKLRINIASFSGENITESMLKCWVVEDRENPYYSDLDDVPAYWKEIVEAMIKDGDIKGDGIHQIGLRRNDLKVAIINRRSIDKLRSELIK